ncbi:MAG: hypothetical protein AW07_04188 [Candidatus Accumulibacter sp. SK-11]|nr:MAG: hypothetical protein AW07_04188 [Candidatus Accumulibacter sp. SK-11]
MTMRARLLASASPLPLVSKTVPWPLASSSMATLSSIRPLPRTPSGSRSVWLRGRDEPAAIGSWRASRASSGSTSSASDSPVSRFLSSSRLLQPLVVATPPVLESSQRMVSSSPAAGGSGCTRSLAMRRSGPLASRCTSSLLSSAVPCGLFSAIVSNASTMTRKLRLPAPLLPAGHGRMDERRKASPTAMLLLPGPGLPVSCSRRIVSPVLSLRTSSSSCQVPVTSPWPWFEVVHETVTRLAGARFASGSTRRSLGTRSGSSWLAPPSLSARACWKWIAKRVSSTCCAACTKCIGGGLPAVDGWLSRLPTTNPLR